MKKNNVAEFLLGERLQNIPAQSLAKAFAPSNIALCKYWGKRNQEINLPLTSSLSVSLGDKGAWTEIKIYDQPHDRIILNNKVMMNDSPFGKRLIEFINLFRKHNLVRFDITIKSTVPIAAGMASSACGFAAITLALNDLYGWQLSKRELSILARLGSGSASRSIWDGFVQWHAGVREDGMDSHGELIPNDWPDLCVGLLILNQKEKELSSREAMQRTLMTSPLYSAWPTIVMKDLGLLKQAISLHDFELLGRTAESNANNMHATMLGAWPPITYYAPETILAMKKVWDLRGDRVQIYFTQDAGPNLKLLFLEKDKKIIREVFPTVDVLQPFTKF